jgi:RsiW-degrading membrane proteinase PrsW (M82 family)
VTYAAVPPLPAPVRQVGAPLAAIVVLGTITALILTLQTAVNPGGTVLGFGLATTAMVVVLLCYLWLDRWEPEPPRLLVLSFLWGASVAVLIAVGLVGLIDASLPQPAPADGQTRFVTAVVAAPLVEEAAKGMFLLVMMTGRRRNELNNLTDCLVYAGFTGAGFAWLENIFYIANGETVASSLAIAGLRLVLGPFAHPLFTTMFAIGVFAALRQRSVAVRVVCLLAGYAAAVLLHGLWNASAVAGGQTYLGVYVMWMMPIFALAVLLAVTSRRRERRIILAQLPAMVGAGLVTPAEAGWLGALGTRKMAVRSAIRDGGRPAGSAVKRFVQQVVELAYVRDRIDRGFGDERVFALQHEEAHRVVAARHTAGPALHRLGGTRFPVR